MRRPELTPARGRSPHADQADTTHQGPIGGSRLRPARQALGLTLTDVATALDCSIGKISQLERGTIRDVRFLHNYRHWLTTTIQPQNAA